MQSFTLTSEMTAMIGGAFYPTGYTLIMFPNPDDANRVGRQLVNAGRSAEEIYLLPAATILSQITPTVTGHDAPLPSVGTDGAAVRALTQFALDGHAGLLVKTGDDDDVGKLMQAVQPTAYSMARRYRLLVIEDL